MDTSGQGYTNVTIYSFPSYFTSTKIWSPAYSVRTRHIIMVANRYATRVDFGFVRIQGLPPTRLTNYITLVVTDITCCTLKIHQNYTYSLSWVIKMGDDIETGGSTGSDY